MKLRRKDECLNSDGQLFMGKSAMQTNSIIKVLGRVQINVFLFY